MNKKLVITSALIAGATVGTQAVNNNVVKADEVPNVHKEVVDSKQQAQQAVDTAKANLDQAKQETAAKEANLNSKKADEATLQKQASDTQKSEENAQNEIATQQKNIEQNKNDLSDVPTHSETLDQVQQKVANAQEKKASAMARYTQDSRKLAQEKDAEKQTNSTYNNQVNLTEKDKKNFDSQQQVLKQAQDNVKNATPENISRLKDDVKKQEQLVNEKEQAVNDTKMTRDSQKEVVRQTQENVAAKQEQMKHTQSEVSAQKVAVQTAQKALDQAKKDVADAQDKLQKAQQATEVVNNTITISNIERYKQAFNNWFSSDHTKIDQDKKVMFQMAGENSFKHSQTDESKMVDTNNLSDEVVNEISLFGANLVNQVRSLPLFTISNSKQR